MMCSRPTGNSLVLYRWRHPAQTLVWFWRQNGAFVFLSFVFVLMDVCAYSTRFAKTKQKTKTKQKQKGKEHPSAHSQRLCTTKSSKAGACSLKSRDSSAFTLWTRSEVCLASGRAKCGCLTTPVRWNQRCVNDV